MTVYIMDLSSGNLTTGTFAPRDPPDETVVLGATELIKPGPKEV
jgi:hypothetical protein